MYPTRLLNATPTLSVIEPDERSLHWSLRLSLLLVLFIFTSLMTGCASITGSRNQPVSVTCTSEGKPVNGANCNLMNDKGQWFVTTPGTVMIQKAYGDLAITCKKDDTTGAATFKSASEGAVWGNVIAGGLIGYAVDASSGAGFSYPQSMNVILGGGSTAAEPGAKPVLPETSR